MQAEQHAMALHQAMARRACIRMTMADGYCYYGVVQTIGGASVYPQPEAQLLPQGCFSFLALDPDGEPQATLTLQLADVAALDDRDPEAQRRKALYICQARGYGPGTRSIRDVVNQLRDRPGMFIGSASLRALKMYLWGYTAACMDADPLWQDAFDWHDFTEYVCDSYGLVMSGRDWCSIICDRYPDDGRAFDEFLRLFDQYHA